MGHEINYLTFNGNCDRGEISAHCDKVSRENSDYHSELYSPIRFSSQVFNSYDEAYDYLDGLSVGNYDNYAVRYKVLQHKDSKKLTEKVAKYTELYQKCSALERTQHYTATTVKSEYIGCKNCGSRLSVKYLRGNSCPLCRRDLRPASTLERIATMKKNLAELDKEVTALKRVEAAKAAEKDKSCPVKWLVRIEYHV